MNFPLTLRTSPFRRSRPLAEGDRIGAFLNGVWLLGSLTSVGCLGLIVHEHQTHGAQAVAPPALAQPDAPSAQHPDLDTLHDA